MRKIVSYAIFLPAVIFALIAPLPASAAPREVILYPDAAYVTEVAKIRLQPAGPDQKKAVFHLPAESDPQSLAVGFEQAAKMQIDSIQPRPIMPDDDDSLKTLRNRLKKTQDERNDLMAHIKALDAQIQFWQAQTKGKAKNATEAVATSSVLGRNVRMLYREKISKEADLEKADKRIAEQAEAIDRQVKSKQPFSEITLLISGAQTGEAVLKYSYLVSGCGWTPRYRIEANTLTGQVVVKEQIHVRQDTITDWKQIVLRIATHRPVDPNRADHGQMPSLAQPDTPAQDPKATGKSMHRKSVVSSIKTDQASGSKFTEPNSGSGVFSVNLGILDVPARSSRIVPLKNDTYPADFIYLLRPAFSPHAAIIATLRQPVALRFPTAEALLSINGAISVNKAVPLSETLANLHVGDDHQVTVDRRLPKKEPVTAPKSDKTGRPAISMEIKNAKSTSVRVVVEEPLLQSTGELDLFDPPPSDRSGRKALWRFELPAGGTKNISAFLRDN